VTLGQKQRVFARLVAKLIEKAYELGYEVSLGDAYRDPCSETVSFWNNPKTTNR